MGSTESTAAAGSFTLLPPAAAIRALWPVAGACLAGADDRCTPLGHTIGCQFDVNGMSIGYVG